MTGGITVISYPSRFIKLTMFLESNAEGSLRLPNVGVEGVVVTRDVVDGAAQFLLGGFVDPRLGKVYSYLFILDQIFADLDV